MHSHLTIHLVEARRVEAALPTHHHDLPRAERRRGPLSLRRRRSAAGERRRGIATA